MPKRVIPSCIFIFSIFVTIIVLTMISEVTSAPIFLYDVCPNTTLFTNNSQYEANLNTLFRYLTSNATNPNGYHQAISSNGDTTDDTVYGHFLCRGDVNISTCQDCVTTATTTDLPMTRCPNRKQAIIWYEECLFRYSFNSFFNKLDELMWRHVSNSHNVTGNATKFDEIMVNMMVNDIAVRAAIGGSQKKFATGYANDTIFRTIYGMGQCTPDLTADDCNTCLVDTTKRLMQTPGRKGGKALMLNCVAAFEIKPFFNLSTLQLPPSPPHQPPSPQPSLTTARLNDSKSSTKMIIGIVVAIVAILAVLLVTAIFWNKYRKGKNTHIEGEDFITLESLQYKLATLQSATNDFSDANKLGEGGFGGVFKGILPNGQLVAVKRLSMNSSQGLQEFKNEVLVVAKLQHRNLVRLLGFCCERQENLLVYEYLSNTSLDKFIFDFDKQGLLDWGKRYKIIRDIARGMLYLHHDSQIRIIHRDLKASNVLLDGNLNSKISDFGMARLSDVDQTHASTSKIVGTIGYMSPEYFMQGHFSTKSDVYSLGVLILEIISGKRNNTFYQSGDAQDLLSYAWKKWRDEMLLELVDPTLKDSCSNNEVTRCVHLGLLCVQESPNDRPSMETIVLTLDNYSISLPVPEPPGLFVKSRLHSNITKESSSDQSLSKNDVSITELEAR